MKLLSAVYLFVIGLLTSCAARGTQLIDLSTFPQWFSDAYARDITITSSSKLDLSLLGMSVTIPGKASLVEESDTMQYYQIDIGSGSPVECYVFTDFDGTATSFHAVIGHSLAGAAKLNDKPLSGQFNFAINSDVIGDTPWMGLDTLYTLGEGDDKVSGLIKGLTARTDESLQICLHNEIGYQQGFFSVFESLINAVIETESTEAFFEPVYRLSLNGTPIGYSREKHSLDEDGDVSTVIDSVFMVPVDASSVSRSDSVATSWSSPDGALINATTYTIENGALQSQMSIQQTDDKWTVEGTIQNKPVSATLDYDSWLLSDFGGYLATAYLANNQAVTSNYAMWVADADPTKAMTVTLSQSAEKEDKFKLNAGPLTLDYIADKRGVMQSGIMNIAGLQIDMTLLYTHGSPVAE